MFSSVIKKDQVPTTRSVAAPSISKSPWGGFEEMDQMFDWLFHGFDQTLSSGSWKAPLAVWEDQEHFYVEVELAGVPLDAVDVTVHDRQLVISYAHKIPEGRQFIHNERCYGCFERRVALPKSVNVEAIKADMCDGLLQITLDKASDAKPRKIAVQPR